MTETKSSHRLAFFRQSGWMMITSVAGGAFMFAVHTVSRRLPDSEYSTFAVLVQIINWMTIPALGLQMVFAQQLSAAITEKQRSQLVGTLHAVMGWTFGLWLIMVLIVGIEGKEIVANLKLSNPASLWITVGVGFLMLWLPIFQGLLQGRQNFMWLGWVQILNGVGRAVISIIVVFVFNLWTASMMAGVFMGLASAVGLSMWHNRDLIRAHGEKFDAAGWLKRVVPMTLGFGVGQFLMSADGIIVKKYLDDGGNAAPYFFGATLARAIPLFTIPLASVMFPKLVQSAARSEKTNVMGLTLIGTVVFGCVAALGLIITGPFVIAHMSKPEYASIMPVLPLFAWVMVPLGVGNVLLYNLMAHSHFKAVPLLALVAVGYWFALLRYHADYMQVIKTLGVFTLIFMAVCAIFTWALSPAEKKADAADGK